jgi:hypothetical protein
MYAKYDPITGLAMIITLRIKANSGYEHIVLKKIKSSSKNRQDNHPTTC